MKLYDSVMAPNPRRVRIFLAEKGISVPTCRSTSARPRIARPSTWPRTRSAACRSSSSTTARSSTESVAICVYFEELHPQPPLLGVDARDKAFVEMWQRRMELGAAL